MPINFCPAPQLPHSPTLVSGKRGDDDLPSLWALPVLRPVNTGYWQEGDKAKRLTTRILGRRGEGLGRRWGGGEPGEGRAGTRVVGSGSSIRGRAAGRHIVRRGPEEHDRHTPISTQPCAQFNLNSYSRTLIVIHGFHTLVLSYPTTCTSNCQSSLTFTPSRLWHQGLTVGLPT